MNNMDFKEIFKAPFHCDDYGLYVFDKNENICLEYYSDRTAYDGGILKQIVNILNDKPSNLSVDITKVTNTVDCFIMFENGDCLIVRGWGYLTGVKNLSNKDAAAVQDSFLDYIVSKIKEVQK